jgi:hypothetical protein
MRHGPKDKNEVDKYAKQSLETEINSSLRVFDIEKIDLNRKGHKITSFALLRMTVFPLSS